MGFGFPQNFGSRHGNRVIRRRQIRLGMKKMFGSRRASRLAKKKGYF